MKHLTLDAQDNIALEEVGRASVQIVHDIKNQLNGLKLYATFLRKRMERRISENGDAPATDELETITKLIGGLDRATADAAVLVRYGRPLELLCQPHTSLGRILSRLAAAADFPDAPNTLADEDYEGEFDSTLLSEALREITTYARLNANTAETGSPIQIRLTGDDVYALIEWSGIKLSSEDDPFHSFAGSDALRMALAAKVIEAHGGTTYYDANTLRVCLPINKSER